MTEHERIEAAMGENEQRRLLGRPPLAVPPDATPAYIASVANGSVNYATKAPTLADIQRCANELDKSVKPAPRTTAMDVLRRMEMELGACRAPRIDDKYWINTKPISKAVLDEVQATLDRVTEDRLSRERGVQRTLMSKPLKVPTAVDVAMTDGDTYVMVNPFDRWEQYEEEGRRLRELQQKMAQEAVSEIAEMQKNGQNTEGAWGLACREIEAIEMQVQRNRDLREKMAQAGVVKEAPHVTVGVDFGGKDFTVEMWCHTQGRRGVSPRFSERVLGIMESDRAGVAAAPKPVPAPPKADPSRVKPAIAGLTVESQRDHRLGMFK